MHVGISLEPAVVLGLMGIEVVENDMEGGITIDSDDVVHEVEKLNAAATLFVSDSDLSGGNLEGSKQGRSAVTLVVMAMTGERPASGELQVSLRPLQRLDRRLFVDTDDDGVLRRRDIEPNDIGGFGGEFGIVSFRTRIYAPKGRSSGCAESARPAAHAHRPGPWRAAVLSSGHIR